MNKTRLDQITAFEAEVSQLRQEVSIHDLTVGTFSSEITVLYDLASGCLATVVVSLDDLRVIRDEGLFAEVLEGLKAALSVSQTAWNRYKVRQNLT